MATFFRILKDKPYLIKFAFSVGLSGAIYGIISRAITSSSPYMNQHADKTILFLLPILSNVAPIIGSILGGLMIDSKGRRDVVMGSDILILLGCFLTASILKPEIILMSRVLIGIGFGLTSVATPLYLMEVAPTEIRGSFASVSSLMVTVAQFVPSLTNLAFKHSNSIWRISFGLAAFICVIQMILLLCLDDSPQMIRMKDDSPDPLPTLNALTRIYSPERALEEYNILRDMIDSIKANEVDIGNTFWRKVKSGFRTAYVRKAILIGMFIQAFPQLVGYATITYFGPQIMQIAGLTLRVETFGIPLLFNTVGSVINFFIIDRLGRRKLIITSFIIIIIDLLCFGFIFQFYPTDEGWGRVAVVLFGLHSITYICGMKTAPAIVNVEILSFAYRGVGESLSAIATSMATLVVSLMFSPIQNSLGSSSIFFLNAGFALFGVILLYFILPETNGVRLERMDNGIQLAIIDNVIPEEHPQNEDMGLQEGPQNEDPELHMLG